MTDIICAIITTVGVIIVAIVGASAKKKDKMLDERAKEADIRAERRAKESLLSMKLMNANCQLTVGVAMALKRGECNGEVEEGLALVKEAMGEYQDFHEKIVVKETTL